MSKDDQSDIRKFFIAIASALKIPVKYIMESAEAIRSIRGKAKSEKSKVQESEIRRKGFHRRLLREFYNSEDNDSRFRQYTILVSNLRYPSTIFSTSNRVGLSIPLSNLDTKYLSESSEPQYNKRLTKVLEEQTVRVANKLKLLGVRIWDQAIYRLLSDPFSGEKPKFSFSVSKFLNYRYSAGLLEDELIDCLIKYENDIPAILQERSTTLPLRNELLPTKTSFTHLSERLSTGGVACIVAMARGAPDHDYIIPLQFRSHAVAEGREIYTGSIQAWHQPNVGDYHNEASLYWTVLRELFEEIYGGDEVIDETAHLRYDWYLKKSPGVEYVLSIVCPQGFRRSIVAWGRLVPSHKK